MFSRICFLIVTVQLLQIANGGTTKRSPDDLPIRYPGPTKKVGAKFGQEEEVPEECRNQNFCTVKPHDYPEDKFNAMFKGSNLAMPPSLVVEPDIGNRQGDPDDKDNCESIVTFDPLYKVRAKRGDWRTVIQAPEENFVQRVRLERCTNPEASCFTIFPPAPDIVTFCKQKFSVWEFLVSDGNNGTEKIKADLPTCCSCHYKMVSILSRFAKPKN